MYRTYKANKSSAHFSTSMFSETSPDSQRLDDLFIAGEFVIGVIILILFINKIITCGIVCGAISP